MFKGRSVCPADLDSVFLRKQKFLNSWWRRVSGLASAGGGISSEILNVESFDAYQSEWGKHGVNPYLDSGDTSNYIGDYPTCSPANDRYYFFEDTELTSWSSVLLHFLSRHRESGFNFYTLRLLYVGTTKISEQFSHTGLKDWGYETWDVSSTFNTVARLNYCKLQCYRGSPGCFVDLAHAYLEVIP